MKIKKILSQIRRDYSAIMCCEFCQHEQEDKSGYDDRYYHDNIIPNMVCRKCGESTISKNGTVDKTPTKYPPHFTV